MTHMRKWIALLLLAVFLPATAMAQSCATRCAYTKQTISLEQTSVTAEQHTTVANDHCAKKTAKVCPFAAVCDFSNLIVLHVVLIEFAPALLAEPPEFLPADFMSVVHPPALRPPAI
jgi:transcriptional regulator GlxA family with amidase domain